MPVMRIFIPSDTSRQGAEAGTTWLQRYMLTKPEFGLVQDELAFHAKALSSFHPSLSQCPRNGSSHGQATKNIHRVALVIATKKKEVDKNVVPRSLAY